MKLNTIFMRLIFGLALMALAGMPAHAGPAEDAMAIQMHICMSYGDNAQRLACFEGIAKTSRTAPNAGVAPRMALPTPISPVPAVPMTVPMAPTPVVPASPVPVVQPRAVTPSVPSRAMPTPVPTAPPAVVASIPPASAQPMEDDDCFLDCRSVSIRATVTNVRADRNGNVFLTLNNGQVWRRSDRSQTVRVKVPVGQQISIVRRMLGSYVMVLDARRSFDVVRIS